MQVWSPSIDLGLLLKPDHSVPLRLQFDPACSYVAASGADWADAKLVVNTASNTL